MRFYITGRIFFVFFFTLFFRQQPPAEAAAGSSRQQGDSAWQAGSCTTATGHLLSSSLPAKTLTLHKAYVLESH